MTHQYLMIQGYTNKELAQYYGVTIQTLRSWIARFRKELNIPARTRVYTPNEVKLILEKLGPGLHETSEASVK